LSCIVSGIGGKYIARNVDMIELHPEILTKNGRKEFVVLPYEEYLAITEALADLEDLQELRAAKSEEGSAATMSLKEASERYGAS
jgi:hypothetical protein